MQEIGYNEAFQYGATLETTHIKPVVGQESPCALARASGANGSKSGGTIYDQKA